MAKLVDPDDLNQGVEITITPGASGTVALAEAGNLSSDGVTVQCVYSFLKEEWKDDGTLIKYPFAMIAITEESFEMTGEWDWSNDATRLLLRDGGWAWKNPAGVSRTEYTNITTLGSFLTPGTDLSYYIQVSAGQAPTDFNLAGPVNQAIQVYGNVDNGNFDYRDFFRVYLREYQATYDDYDLLLEQNLSTLTYKKYAMPLANASDALKITNNDGVVGAGGEPYEPIDVTYYDSAQNIAVGVGSYDFHVVIDADGKTAEQVYEKIQFLLRQDYDINESLTTPNVTGSIGDELLFFVGDTLKCSFNDTWAKPSFGGGGGVIIINYAPADTNRLVFIDDTGTEREELFVSTGRITFNTNLLGDTDAFYWMFFTSVPSGDYGTSDAYIVDDASSIPISGSITNNPSITAGNDYIDFTFDYDQNTQGGRSLGTAATTIVSIGLETAQFVSSTALTIARTKTNNISLVAALERNYANPD
jgi:hypothetical protein